MDTSSNTTVAFYNDSTIVFVGNTTTVWGTESSTVVPSGPSPSLQTYQQRVILAVVWLLVTLANVTGNSMVILAVVFSKKLRTSTNVFVVSLSVADLLTGLALPMSAVGLLTPGNSWPWSTETPCCLAGLLLYISLSASLFNLASMALNRLILIKRPRTLYRSLYTKRNLVINVAILWIVAISTMAVPPLFGIGGFGYDEQHHTCSDLDTHPKARAFEMIQTSISYPIPLAIIFTCYTMIYIHVRHHFKVQGGMHGGSCATTAPDTTSSGSTGKFVRSNSSTVVKSANQHRISRHQLEITKNLFIAVCAFFVCITPYSLSLLITDSYVMFLGVLYTCNSFVNPIIYAAKHPQFKKVMRCMWQCKYSQIEEPSDTLKTLIACCN